MANDDPSAPQDPTPANDALPVVGGKKGGREVAPDPTSARQLIDTTIERAPLVAQSADIEAGRNADIAKTTRDSNETAGRGYDSALGNAQIADQKYTEHSDDIRNKLMNMSPLMTRDQYWNNKSTGDKILAGIGLFMGGISGTNAMQKAIEQDFDTDRKQHELDFKRYAEAHGIDNDENNRAKYMNIVRTEYVKQGLNLANRDLAATTAQANSEQAKLAGQNGLIDLKDRIIQLGQVNRDYARQAGAAAAAQAQQAQKRMLDQTNKNVELGMSPDEAGRTAVDQLPGDAKFLGAHGQLPGDLQVEYQSKTKLNKVIADYTKVMGHPPTDAELDAVKGGLFGPKNADGTFGDPGKLQWKQDKFGNMVLNKGDASSSGSSGWISAKARAEGRVVQVPDENGKMVEREAVNPDSVKRIEEFGDARDKSLRLMDVIKDPNQPEAARVEAFQDLKSLAPKMTTGSTRPLGQAGGNGFWSRIISTGFDAVKVEDLARNPEILATLKSEIDGSYRRTLDTGIRGGYRGNIPDIVPLSPTTPSAPAIPKPTFQNPLLPPGSAGYNPSGRPGEGVAPNLPNKPSFAQKYGAGTGGGSSK
jgi:hypothetical protein